MATAGRKTDEVLAAARRDVQEQLDVVRDELTRLAAEEAALTQALASLDGDGITAASVSQTKSRSRPPKSRGSTRRPTARRRAASKSTAERVDQLRGLLADGPKSRAQLAAALDVSPARVQQLLSALGGAVSSRPDPSQGRSRLWSLKGSANGGGRRKARS